MRLPSVSRYVVALMTDKISTLTTHMVTYKKDKAKKRSMAIAVGQRRRMMKYLLRLCPGTFATLLYFFFFFFICLLVGRQHAN